MSDNPYFSEDFLDFFKELAANNHKDWFDENRKRYEKNVKKPFEQFIHDLIIQLRSLDPDLTLSYKDAIFRINRDIRFSKDKSPYKLDRSAIISAYGRKDKSYPGMYLSLGPGRSVMGGGAYSLDAEQLARLRHKMVQEDGRLREILNDEAFNKLYSDILGEEHKRLPRELRKAAAQQPLLFKKQFYYMHEMEPDLVLKPKLMDTALEHFKVALPLQQFLKEAIK